MAEDRRSSVNNVTTAVGTDRSLATTGGREDESLFDALTGVVLVGVVVVRGVVFATGVAEAVGLDEVVALGVGLGADVVGVGLGVGVAVAAAAITKVDSLLIPLFPAASLERF